MSIALDANRSASDLSASGTEALEFLIATLEAGMVPALVGSDAATLAGFAAARVSGGRIAQLDATAGLVTARLPTKPDAREAGLEALAGSVGGVVLGTITRGDDGPIETWLPSVCHERHDGPTKHRLMRCLLLSPKDVAEALEVVPSLTVIGAHDLFGDHAATP